MAMMTDLVDRLQGCITQSMSIIVSAYTVESESSIILVMWSLTESLIQTRTLNLMADARRMTGRL